MSTEIQVVGARQDVDVWSRVLLMVVLTVALMLMVSGAYANDGTEFQEAVTKWDGWVKGNLGKLGALIALALGIIYAAIKKDWGAFLSAVIISMGVGIILGIINASFTAVL